MFVKLCFVSARSLRFGHTLLTSKVGGSKLYLSQLSSLSLSTQKPSPSQASIVGYMKLVHGGCCVAMEVLSISSCVTWKVELAHFVEVRHGRA